MIFNVSQLALTFREEIKPTSAEYSGLTYNALLDSFFLVHPFFIPDYTGIKNINKINCYAPTAFAHVIVEGLHQLIPQKYHP